MSSAILYLAIIAIWAGVLIPRWLRRDSAEIKAAKQARQAAELADEAAARSREGRVEDDGNGGY